MGKATLLKVGQKVLLTSKSPILTGLSGCGAYQEYGSPAYYRYGRPYFVAESFQKDPQIATDQAVERKKQEDKMANNAKKVDRMLKEQQTASVHSSPCAVHSTWS